MVEVTIGLLAFRRPAMLDTIGLLTRGAVLHLCHRRGALSHGWCCAALTPLQHHRSTVVQHLRSALLTKCGPRRRSAQTRCGEKACTRLLETIPCVHIVEKMFHYAKHQENTRLMWALQAGVISAARAAGGLQGDGPCQSLMALAAGVQVLLVVYSQQITPTRTCSGGSIWTTAVALAVPRSSSAGRARAAGHAVALLPGSIHAIAAPDRLCSFASPAVMAKPKRRCSATLRSRRS
jgi:hypothetical protein